MKKLDLCLGIFIFSLFSNACSSSKQARTYKREINGHWQLQTVVSEGITGKIKIQLFNEADFNCFVGSNWNFDYRNSLGSYILDKNAGECVSIKREIRWSIFEAPGEAKLFQFKRLNKDLKDLDENAGGFRFTILQLDDHVMKLKSDINFEGKPASIIYNFIKN